VKTDRSRVHDEPTQSEPGAGEAEMKTRRQEHHPDGWRATRSTGGGQRPIRERSGRRREYERRKMSGDLQDPVVETSPETGRTTLVAGGAAARAREARASQRERRPRLGPAGGEWGLGFGGGSGYGGGGGGLILPPLGAGPGR